MNNVNNINYVNSSEYQEFLKANPNRGSLKIRAYAAKEAVPISGLKIVITNKINNNNVIFFEGVTDNSGVIERISLPAPEINTDNLEIPNYLTYDINATYVPDNINRVYKVNIYANVCVVQNINITPELQVGAFNGN